MRDFTFNNVSNTEYGVASCCVYVEDNVANGSKG